MKVCMGCTRLIACIATAEGQWVFLAIPEEKEKRRFVECLVTLGIV